MWLFFVHLLLMVALVGIVAFILSFGWALFTTLNKIIYVPVARDNQTYLRRHGLGPIPHPREVINFNRTKEGVDWRDEGF